ncbi:MAG TPA: hypothetical protein DCS19_04315 [Flavobacterium sp.]|nr:hypothetical protein [Flavobacterium sp.]
MKKISNKDDLKLCIDLIKKIDYGYNHELFLNHVPEILKGIFEDGATAYPLNLTTDFFKNLYVEYLLSFNPKFILDKNSENIIDKISQYATRNEIFIKESFSFDKGILLMGKVGCGKTLLFQCLVNLLRLFVGYNINSTKVEKLDANFIPAYSLVEMFSIKGYEMFGSELYFNNNRITLMSERLFIDDLGSENIVSNYGNTTNVTGELILRRYDKGRKTFATTNLDPKTLKSFYGDRVYSRMIEMFNFIVVDGEDRRC